MKRKDILKSSPYLSIHPYARRIASLLALVWVLLSCVVSVVWADKPSASVPSSTSSKSIRDGKTSAPVPAPVLAPLPPAPVLPDPAFELGGPDRPSGKRALAWLKATVEVGNRYYGAPYRDLALTHLERSLQAATDQAERDPFTATEPVSNNTYSLVNLVGRTHPERKARVLLGSHFDTRLWAEKDPDESKRDLPIVGANDGTSGLAVLLDVLRVLKQVPLSKIGLDVVFFDGEEFGRPLSKDYCKGSRHYVKGPQFQPPKEKPGLAVIVDMVGDEHLNIRPEYSSLVSAPDLMKLIWSTANDLNATGFTFDKTIHIIDDHTPLQEVGVPAVLLIDFDYPHWHTHRDTVDKVRPQSLEEAATVLLTVLRTLDESI